MFYKPRIAINGLGRIGRTFLKIAIEKNMDIVAINDLASPESLVYLLKYDSVYGVYDKKIRLEKDFLIINNKRVRIFSEKDPLYLPWKELKVDVVIESTGFFTEREGAERHIKAGAKKVLISAPAKNPDITVVLGVNERELKTEDRIISMASCTTNCLAPLAKVLNDHYTIKKGFMTTVHAYTSSQNTLDGPQKKFRRGRAAAQNIVPTSTGATKAVVEVIPELRNKIDGVAMRVPVACGSIVDFVAELKKTPKSKEEVNRILKKESETKMKGILQYSEEELVSSDIIKNSYSSIIDGLSTQIIGNTVKVLSWYDNEYGYSNRLADCIKILKF